VRGEAGCDASRRRRPAQAALFGRQRRAASGVGHGGAGRGVAGMGAREHGQMAVACARGRADARAQELGRAARFGAPCARGGERGVRGREQGGGERRGARAGAPSSCGAGVCAKRLRPSVRVRARGSGAGQAGERRARLEREQGGRGVAACA